MAQRTTGMLRLQVVCLVGWLVRWVGVVGCVVGWLVDGWMVSLFVGWLIGCLVLFVFDLACNEFYQI